MQPLMFQIHTLTPLPKLPIPHKFLAIPLSFLSTNSFPSPQLEGEHEQSIANTTYWTKKIHRLCTRDRNVDEALRLLNTLTLHGYRPDSLNLSSIIHALCDSTRFEEAHHRLSLFLASNCVPDERTCNVLIAKLLDSRNPRSTLQIIQRLFLVKPDFVPSLINYNRLMDQLCSVSKPGEAHGLIYDMKSRGHRPNVVSYTTVIDGYCGVGDVSNAEKVLDEMCESGVMPNSLTYSVIIRGILRKRDIERGREFICELWKKMKEEEEEEDQLVKNAAFANLIESLCREGLFQEVFRIAEEFPPGKCVSEEFAYGQMIDSLCKVGRHDGASRIVYIMRKKGFLPSKVSYNHIIHGLCKDGAYMRAYQLLKEGTEFGFFPSEDTYKVLQEGLCKELDVPKAREVLNLMLRKEGADRTRIYNIYLRALCLTNNPTELLNVLVSMYQSQCQADVITLNTVINGFCKMGKVDEALKVLNDMIIAKFSPPDAVTFTTIICGLLSVGRIDEALNILHKDMPDKGFNPGVITYNAVLQGLFKHGRTDKAMAVFRTMTSGGVAADSTTNTIIVDGLCHCNHIEEAKRFWNDVIWPSGVHDNFVYAAILKGFCHSGRFNEACHFLYELVDSGVSLNIFSYNIVIDSACKQGLKKEAYQIVREMRRNGLTPDSVTWRILDKLHRKVKTHLCLED